MKAKRYIVSVIDCDCEDDNVIANAIYDALENDAQDNDESAIYNCSFAVNLYK